MKLYTSVLEQLAPFDELLGQIRSNTLPSVLVGLSAIHKAHFIYGVAEMQDRPCIVLAEDEQSGRRLVDDLNAMSADRAGDDLAAFFPARDYNLRELEVASREYEQLRLGVLSRMLDCRVRVVVASIDAAMQVTIPPEELARRTAIIDAKKSYSAQQLTEMLLAAGYVRRPQVDGVSQFSVRGGIVDFFPPHLPNPIRIELWGDEIDTMSTFDLDTQRRTDTVKQVKISPAAEVLVSGPEALRAIIERMQAALGRGKHAQTAKARLDKDLERLDNDLEIYSIDRFLPVAYDRQATLLDYFEQPVVFFSEYHNCKERAKNFLAQQAEDIKILLEEGELCELNCNFTTDFGALCSAAERTGTVYLDTFARSHPDVKARSLITANALQNSGWSGEMKLLVDDLTALVGQGYCCAVLAGTAKAASTLAGDLRKAGIPADYVKDMKSVTFRKVFVLEGNLSAGFDYPELKFSLITNTRTQKLSTKRAKKRKGEEIRSLSDLHVGDPVVHVAHGIGIFDGINKLDLHGIVKDYIKIKYAGADTLYVPVTQLDLVSKYIGPKDDGKIKLNRLNSGEWQKTRSRVKKAVAEMADELIKLYAARMQTKGYAFSEDNDWQREFEEHFPYEETDDQLRCIEEIKQDMVRSVPMERLLCGDVGFGKTEVALRAAFKCVLDGKQCAILCPTTILAWQHYQTLLQRFEGFPVNIALLSRFRTPKQQKETIKELKAGLVDIVVGTHRLVQNDVIFKDLGLAIIDEEQRFGVAHKEKFKTLFHGVDLLTLSATPIPRTLNMAMSGIRDMSVIEEAPQDRYPVQTYVVEYDIGLITEALQRELRRGGQVYYIHNRIESIDLCAAKIHNAIPEARIGIAHGRMDEDELSDIWRKLMEHEIDILVCTTLIETGVDVANCNTLIIEDADNMGLSQLYQLRGRVGRSNRRAYAYFTFRRGKALSEVAEKRLSAIREFTQFGSGFRIAMRDLEIRGAGSILGARQHGHMEAVGYDMYLRLLSDAMEESKGNKPAPTSEECLVDLQIEAHIPEDYIANLSQRLDVYRKIAAIHSEDDAMDVTDELIDRFGEPPAAVRGLVDVALLRNRAAAHGFYEINQKNDAILFQCRSLDMELCGILLGALGKRVSVGAGNAPYLAVKIPKGKTASDVIREVLRSLESIPSGGQAADRTENAE